MLGVISFAPSRKQIKMPCRVCRSAMGREVLGNQLSRSSHQLIVVRPQKEVLTVLVRFPRSVENAADQA